MATPRQTYCGVRLQRSTDPGGSTFETISKLVAPATSRIQRESISLQNTEACWEESIPSQLKMLEPTEYTILFDRNDPVHVKLLQDAKTDYDYKASYNWQEIDSAGNVMFACMGYITDVGDVYAADAADNLTFTVKWTGMPTVFGGN